MSIEYLSQSELSGFNQINWLIDYWINRNSITDVNVINSYLLARNNNSTVTHTHTNIYTSRVFEKTRLSRKISPIERSKTKFKLLSWIDSFNVIECKQWNHQKSSNIVLDRFSNQFANQHICTWICFLTYNFCLFFDKNARHTLPFGQKNYDQDS